MYPVLDADKPKAFQRSTALSDEMQVMKNTDERSRAGMGF